MELEKFIEDEVFSPALVAKALRTRKSEIAQTLGLRREVLSRKDRVKADKTQTLLRHMLEILNRVERTTGSIMVAYAWYRSEPLSGFGNATADRLVREGKSHYVHAYLDHVDSGGYA